MNPSFFHRVAQRILRTQGDRDLRAATVLLPNYHAAQPLAQVPDLTLLMFDKRSGWQQRARLREQADAAGRYVAEVGVPPGARYELFVGSASRDLPYVQGRLMAADALGARP